MPSGRSKQHMECSGSYPPPMYAEMVMEDTNRTERTGRTGAGTSAFIKLLFALDIKAIYDYYGKGQKL